MLSMYMLDVNEYLTSEYVVDLAPADAGVSVCIDDARVNRLHRPPQARGYVDTAGHLSETETTLDRNDTFGLHSV
jgi:hypothetical protein